MNVSVDVGLKVLQSEQELDKLIAAGVQYLSVPCEVFLLKDHEIESIRKALDARALRVDTCHLPFGGGAREHSVSSDDETVRKNTEEMWKFFLRRFPLLSVRATPMHMGGCMRPEAPSFLRDNLTRTLEGVLPEAKKAGTIIALENTFYSNPSQYVTPLPPFGHERYANDCCAMLADYVRAHSDPNVGVCHDVGHSNIFGNRVPDDFETLLPLVKLYHIHDNRGVNDDHIMPGLGTIPYAALGERLRQTHYELPLFAEVLNDPDPARRALIHSAEGAIMTLRETLKALGE